MGDIMTEISNMSEIKIRIEGTRRTDCFQHPELLNMPIKDEEYDTYVEPSGWVDMADLIKKYSDIKRVQVKLA
jgi:hypothetical protein